MFDKYQYFLNIFTYGGASYKEVVFTELNGDPLPQEDGIMPTELAQDSNPDESESVYDDDGGGKNVATSTSDRKLPPKAKDQASQETRRASNSSGRTHLLRGE